MPNQEALNQVVSVLLQREADVTKNWIQIVSSRSKGRTSAGEVQRELLALLQALLPAIRLAGFNVNDDAFAESRAILTELSRSRARQGFLPSETASAIFGLKDAVLSLLQNADSETYADFIPFSRFIDDLGLLTFEAFVAARESVISNQAEQLLELSTPVVKLWDGILAVPLVGTLDSARTQVVMESLLEALVTTSSAHAIIDITGVPAVDTQVAQHLLKTVVAARLMGAECVISGIRPQIAQTIVALGVEFGDIATKSSLADALRLTMRRAGLEVRKVERAP